MNNRGLNRILVIVGVCATAGALAGIAGSAAAPSKTKSSAASKATGKSKAAQKRNAARRAALRARRGPGPGFGFRRGLGGPPVHSEAVVPNADGTGFDTVTMDSGKLESVDGNELTIKEGTEKATYKTVKIDVGGDATVVRNHEKATLSDLKADDNVHVVQGPKGNFVMAESDAFRAQEQKEHGHFRRGAGPPPPDGPPGPPPAGAWG